MAASESKLLTPSVIRAIGYWLQGMHIQVNVMDESAYFEQFVGDTRVFNIWRDSRIENMLLMAGLMCFADGRVSYTQDSADKYHVASHIFTPDQMIDMLRKISAAYQIYGIEGHRHQFRDDTSFVSFFCGVYPKMRGEFQGDY